MYINRGAHRHVYAQRHICKDAHTYIFAYMHTEIIHTQRCLHTHIDTHRELCAYTHVQTDMHRCSQMHMHVQAHAHPYMYFGIKASMFILSHTYKSYNYIYHMRVSIHVGMCVHTVMHMRTQRHTCAYPAHWWIPTRVLLMPSKC